MSQEAVKWAVAGDNVLITLNGVDIQHLNVGNVICGADNLVPVTTHFRGTIVTFDINIPLTIGVPVSILTVWSFNSLHLKWFWYRLFCIIKARMNQAESLSWCRSSTKAPAR
jgi:translation elongation factor EF-1alpha